MKTPVSESLHIILAFAAVTAIIANTTDMSLSVI
jgi:hypothetical protein